MARKQQRVKTIGLPRMDQNRAMMGLSDEDSDDDAPEEMTFEESKFRALESVKVALESNRREKEQLKEKRRRRHELFQEQKKRKLLSAEVLDQIDSSPLTNADLSTEEPTDAAEIKKSRRKDQSRTVRGHYSVRTLKVQELASGQQKTAEDFIQSRLYGPGTRRTTSCELLSLSNKTGTKKSAAVDFVKKSWAPKLKAKSEKVKKRWQHKQQV